MTRPLEDVRVLAVEQYGAGPWGSLHLAELGADVIKLEDPRSNGDIGRYVPPFQSDEDSLFFETFNRGKRSISLDLTNDAGREVFEDLVRSADAVYSNLRGDVPAKLRIRYKDLKHVNERIVCCSLSAFGMTGPRAAEPGYDYVIQGMTGWMSLTGEPDGPPAKTGLSLVDYSGGLVAALALVTGVHAARRDGVGMDCDVSLFDTALSMLTYPATWSLSRGFEARRTRQSAHPSIFPFQNFPTADGWIVVACPKQKFWVRLVEALDMPELVSDPRSRDFAARDQNRGVLSELLTEKLLTRDTSDWVTLLGAAGVPVGPVNDVAQALEDPQVAARNLIVETDHPVLGTVRSVRTASQVGGRSMEVHRAPRRNEHVLPVLGDVAGYTQEDIEALAKRGAFGDVPIDTRASSGTGAGG